MGRVVTLSAAAALLLGGVIEADDKGLSAALFGAGFMTLGAWLAQEIRRDRDG